jgi:hypothetical protein
VVGRYRDQLIEVRVMMGGWVVVGLRTDFEHGKEYAGGHILRFVFGTIDCARSCH